MKNLCLFRKNEPTINDMETCTTMVHHHPVSWSTYRLLTTCATLAIPGSLPERERAEVFCSISVFSCTSRVSGNAIIV